LLNTLQQKFELSNKSPSETDNSLTTLVTHGTNIETMVEGYNEALKGACNYTFIMQSSTRYPGTHKSVPWWTPELTALRKRTNALRRIYQRTQNDEGLRNTRKRQYIDSKIIYAAKIKAEKRNSSKEFCKISTTTNPWGAIYNLASGRGNAKTHT